MARNGNKKKWLHGIIYKKPFWGLIKGLVLRCVYPLVGLIALLWFLVRVIPKPSRATYPCQRAAFPIASSFVIYLIGLFGAAVAFRKANHRLRQARYWVAFLCAVCGLLIICFMISYDSRQAVAAAFVPADSPISPIGGAKGVFPGRVVWVHDPNATSWDGTSYYWWDNNHSDPAVIESMLTKAVCWLTQKPNEPDAWESLFRQYNKTHGKGDVGYSTGEWIVIKPNHNNQLSHNSNGNGVPDTPPAVYVALLKQLVYNAEVDPNYIIISESSRYIDDKTYNACVALFPQVRYEETNYYLPEKNPGTMGRQKAIPAPNAIIWSSTEQQIANFPVAKTFVDADYVINLARMQGHGFAGATLCAKNWYGCFCQSPDSDGALHNMLSSPQYNKYSPLVDLMGHKYLGDKTVLYLLDGLWGFEINYTGTPKRFTYSPFNGDYPSTLLASQDPVAIDSVGLDLLAAQFSLKNVPIDSYLHEAALADNPPSGVVYDPEGDGARLSSLGVHEHWNNPIDKKYSRNLGTGDGIELVYVSPQTGNYRLAGDFNVDGQVSDADLELLSGRWLAQVGSPNWDVKFDIAPAGGDGKIDKQDFMMLSQSWTPAPCGTEFAADFNDDCRVGIEEMQMMAKAWLSQSGQPNWDARCDIAPAGGGDGKIDFLDFANLSTDWLNQ